MHRHYAIFGLTSNKNFRCVVYAYVHRCRYTAGDHVAIYPENDVALVERIGELLEVDLDQIFSLVNKDGEH